MRVCAIVSLAWIASLLIAPFPARGDTASLGMRGSVEGFPFSLGTTMYGGMWDSNAANESRTDWWWFDRAVWTAKFVEMERLHLNTLVFTHPHPYVALVDVPGYPESRYFDADVLDRYREQFAWITGEGVAHGVRIYFLTWNIVVPPRFAQAHGISEFGVDTPLTRGYTRAAVAALFRSYPDLGGLVTMAAESPPGCVDFVEDAAVGGLLDSGTLPELIFWSWCSYPVDSQRIVKRYPRTKLLHYLQYEQFFKPMADPRMARFSEACGTAPMVALGGPKSAHDYLFWGDPEWARETVRDVRAKHGDGLLIETYCAESWTAHEAFAYYTYHLDEPYDAPAWARRIGGHYGHPELGTALLDAMTHASRIVPRFLALVHSQTDHFAPQMGLPLVYYLGMPTLSSYVFENVQTVDAEGFLRPNMGLCWPNPDWGECIASVDDFARDGEKPGVTGPLDIARDIQEHADACLAALALLPDETPPIETVKTQLEMNAHLGSHFAAKIRSAVAWAQSRCGKDTGAECLSQLEASIHAWERVCVSASKRYPEPVSCWRSELTSQPPWRQNQVWAAYAMGKGHWRDRLEPFRREASLIREALARPAPERILPLWEDLLAAPAAQCEPVFAEDFEACDDGRWVFDDTAAITHDPAETITGHGALRLDSRALSGEWHSCICAKPGTCVLTPGERYQAVFDYRVVAEGVEDPDTLFAMAARTPSGGIAHDIGTGRLWTGRAGSLGRRTIALAPETYGDYAIFFSLHGKACIVIDNLAVWRLKGEKND